MGSLVLLARLARRGLGRHVGDGLLLAAALTVAATSLTLGLVLHGRTAGPYAHTRSLTRGPDVVAGVLPEPNKSVTAKQRSELTALMTSPSVARTSGPFPTTWRPLSFGHTRGAVEVQGRDRESSAVDQPVVTSGTWIRPGSVVLEKAFANALGAHVGMLVRIGGRAFPVTGIAVTAAVTPYPGVCFLGCTLATPTLAASEPGLAWLTRPDTQALATRTEPIALTANLVLRRDVQAEHFVTEHQSDSTTAPLLTSWRAIEAHDDKAIRNVRAVLVLGGSLLSLLAIATVTVLVAGRLAQEIRSVGTLKAIGATPAFITTTLLTQYVTIAVVGTAAGVGLAVAIAPHLDAPSTGLLGSAGAAVIGPATIAVVLAIIVGLTVASAAGTVLRAARTSTASALAESPRRPRRRRVLIALSTRLPTAGLLGLRLVARRPRRSLVAAAAGVAVAVCGIVVVVLARAKIGTEHTHLAGGLADPNVDRLNEVMFVLTVLLTVLSLVNLVFVASATAAEARVSLAVVQALGASPTARIGALATALALPAMLGAVAGLPAGIGLYAALNNSDTNSATPTLELIAVAPVTVAVSAALAAVTGRFHARQPLVATLQSAAT